MAFCALFLIMGIYAIIGVNFWKDSFPEYFGTFMKAVLSLLQIMSFDSWCSGIAREIIFDTGIIAAVYFVSYVFVSSIVMANVLIALLLDEFMSASQEIDNDVEDATNKDFKQNCEDCKTALFNKAADGFDEIGKNVNAFNFLWASPTNLTPGYTSRNSEMGERRIGRGGCSEYIDLESRAWKSRVDERIDTLMQRTSKLSNKCDDMNLKLESFLKKISIVLELNLQRQCIKKTHVDEALMRKTTPLLNTQANQRRGSIIKRRGLKSYSIGRQSEKAFEGDDFL